MKRKRKSFVGAFMGSYFVRAKIDGVTKMLSDSVLGSIPLKFAICITDSILVVLIDHTTSVDGTALHILRIIT